MNAFTLWTVPALDNVDVATGKRSYGVAYSGEVWFRFYGNFLYCHQGGDRDASAKMERRNS